MIFDFRYLIVTDCNFPKLDLTVIKFNYERLQSTTAKSLKSNLTIPHVISSSPPEWQILGLHVHSLSSSPFLGLSRKGVLFLPIETTKTDVSLHANRRTPLLPNIEIKFLFIGDSLLILVMDFPINRKFQPTNAPN